jgi:hypothetical protein
MEGLQEQVSALVRQGQELRTSGAGAASLEQNRLELVRRQWELCHALIEQRLPQTA